MVLRAHFLGTPGAPLSTSSTGVVHDCPLGIIFFLGAATVISSVSPPRLDVSRFHDGTFYLGARPTLRHWSFHPPVFLLSFFEEFAPFSIP